MRVRDLSSDEIAKSHIRYLAGGRANVTDERLFSFEFPERTGALYRFLTELTRSTAGFNISLWHYRNYGGDVAKILAGIQVPEGSEAELASFLKDIGYPHREETNNMSYRMFMRSDEANEEALEVARANANANVDSNMDSNGV